MQLRRLLDLRHQRFLQRRAGAARFTDRLVDQAVLTLSANRAISSSRMRARDSRMRSASSTITPARRGPIRRHSLRGLARRGLPPSV
ncbi:hypothetical protein c2A224 [Aromatoleum aromaticum EbN1]|uniref:Uncharacterized protein n=1 Tax=Aromatoleum aromaticum (strain DSM 19018 / LMG 30748 / EbN1) TaxID=76114 RepID=Q5P682_AROAE|nr:hypothetical protein c2A224 [Aromatoleum aromaticum EbN1]